MFEDSSVYEDLLDVFGRSACDGAGAHSDRHAHHRRREAQRKGCGTTDVQEAQHRGRQSRLTCGRVRIQSPEYLRRDVASIYRERAIADAGGVLRLVSRRCLFSTVRTTGQRSEPWFVGAVEAEGGDATGFSIVLYWTQS